MIPRGHQQELLSFAYVRAIAARAGLICCEFDRDYGIDVSVRDVRQSGNAFVDSGIQIDLQLKSTTRAQVGGSAVTYDLNVRNYNHLRVANANCPRLLVVFVMPDDETQWLTQTIDELVLRHCAYWLSLKGHPEKESSATVRVAIPKESVFSVAAIQAMMQQLQERSNS